MNLTDLINKIYSKKTSIAVTALVVAAYVGAPPEQATIIACVAIVAQTVVDIIKIKRGDTPPPEPKAE